MSKTILSIFFVTLFSIGFLSACGVKPAKLEKPINNSSTEYPKTYPSKK